MKTPPEACRRVRETRKKMGWSQARVAERTGVSRDTVGRIERGQFPHSVFLGNLSELAGVSCDWLVLGKKTRARRLGDPPTITKLDEAVLVEALAGVEEELQELEVTLEPKKKAELIALLYDMMGRDEGARLGRTHIAKMIQLAT